VPIAGTHLIPEPSLELAQQRVSAMAEFQK
jgi:hypothetical protein